MSTLACQNCGSRDIEQQDASGATVCMKCGVVLEEDAIVSAVEFVENAGGASSMVGQWVSGTSSKAYTGGNRGGYGFSRDSRETTLANGRRKIQEVASRLRLRGTLSMRPIDCLQLLWKRTLCKDDERFMWLQPACTLPVVRNRHNIC